MNRKKKKLQLNRQTIRSLDARDLARVVGGHAQRPLSHAGCYVSDVPEDCSGFGNNHHGNNG
jgi:hypothetical protein